MAVSEERKSRRREALLEVAFLERIRRVRPDDALTLRALGHGYAATGRWKESLEVDERVIRLDPDDPVAWYNLACSLARCGQREEGFQALETAVRLGYADAEWAMKDEDLSALREDGRFALLIRRMEKCSKT